MSDKRDLLDDSVNPTLGRFRFLVDVTDEAKVIRGIFERQIRDVNVEYEAYPEVPPAPALLV
jgi:hypothetical protein